jgi:hypothetical protein
MTSQQLLPIAKKLADLIDFKYKNFSLTDDYNNQIDFGANIDNFIEGLNAKSEKIYLSLVRHTVNKNNFPDLLEALEAPFVTFVKDGEQVYPVIFYKHSGETEVYVVAQNGSIDTDDDAHRYWEKLVETAKDEITYLVPFPLPSMVSDDEVGTPTASPIKRLYKLLSAEKKDIVYLYFYAFLIAIVNLSLPLGIQSILQLVSGGVIFNSIVLLIGFVILGVLAGGVLQIMQY